VCLKESGVVSMVVNVLLVDDEPQIRKLLANLLSRDRSYQVITASSGEEALDLSRNRSERIDILITDIDMGEMSGIELYTHIREEPPETEVLFISAMAHCIRESLPVLQKPFKPRQFVAKVAEVLSTPKPDGSRVSV
jgi:two-component system cell cycle sensor histidine kinase/response regulator CckA